MFYVRAEQLLYMEYTMVIPNVQEIIAKRCTKTRFTRTVA